MIISESVEIKIGSKNFYHYKNLGYKVKYGDKIEVKAEHLSPENKIHIKAKCDICGKIKEIEYRSYLKNISKYPLYCCNTSCAKIKENKTKMEIYGDNYESIRVNNMKKTNKERYGNENASQVFRREKDQNVFIDQLKEIYEKEDFDYSKINYINNYTKVEIICKIHGLFEKRPNDLLVGQNCQKCGYIKLRLNKIKRISENKLNGNQLVPFFNKKGCIKFDEIKKNENIHIQHAMNGGEFYIKELGYWLDGYDAINNVAYEYDEDYHFTEKQITKDITRQNEIESFLKCKFIRIKDL